MISLFFSPKTIAVIGATANPKKFGNAVTINILRNKDLACELYLITQNTKEILGIKCFKSILEKLYRLEKGEAGYFFTRSLKISGMNNQQRNPDLSGWSR